MPLLRSLLLSTIFFTNYAIAADPFDLSFLTKGAAIGDSYAAGIGAGNIVHYGCSRYDGSYSNIVAWQLGVDPKKFDFTYSACSGAVISGVKKQASRLSTGQQFVIVSAGGNDADLVGILNSCVYSFFGRLSHPDCNKKLQESGIIIRATKFASDLDGLINQVKSKLAPGGNIYYVGYAKFFDASDKTCDGVSWHYWFNLFTREYLTQARRKGMNDLVDLMNVALRAAVKRAGPQVHFIDYDEYVGMTNGRYCQPGQDESSGKSANRQDLFFYEMKTRDKPVLPQDTWHTELKRRGNTLNDDGDIEPVNSTLGAQYGALMLETIEDHIIVAVQDDNSNNELAAEVRDEEELGIFPRDSILKSLQLSHFDPRHASIFSLSKTTNPSPSAPLTLGSHSDLSYGHAHHHSTSTALSRSYGKAFRSELLALHTNTASPGHLGAQHSESRKAPTRPTIASAVHRSSASGKTSASVIRASAASTGHFTPRNSTRLGTKMYYLDTAGTLKFTISNTTRLSNSTSTGTVIANGTHVLLAGNKIAVGSTLRKLFVPDTAARVFHPTQGGHILIANLILYQMVANNAKVLGIQDFPPEVQNSIGNARPQIGGAACNTGSSDTWAGRDAMISAVHSFCRDPHNLRGASGKSTSGIFNSNSLDYMNISIRWENPGNLSEHSCEAWLDVVTDGCDATSNPGNWKHGGSIPYDSKVVNATLVVEPLVVRQIWDKGRAHGQQCSQGPGYLDQATLQSNIDNYCEQSAAQPGGVAKAGSSFFLPYNAGTADAVSLITTWPAGSRNFQVFKDECQYYMSVLNNGCSLPGPDNKLNWKHGGSMTDNNGVTYKILPTAKRPLPPPSAPQGICKVERKSYGYLWHVWGGGWANADFGAELSKQMSGCGLVTGFTFNYGDFSATGGPGVEWEANGTLPYFIKSHCVKRAILSAGGFPSNC